MNRKKTASSSSTRGLPLLLRHAAIGAGVGLGIACLLCPLGAWLCLLAPDPASLTLPAGILLLLLCATAGGFCSARLHGSRRLLCGVLCGSLMAVLLWILTLFLGEPAHGIPFFPALLLRILTVGVSALGAMIPVEGRKKRRRRRRA